MKYRIEYKDGKTIEVEAERTIDVVRKYDLATKENIGVKIMRVGEEHPVTLTLNVNS